MDGNEVKTKKKNLLLTIIIAVIVAAIAGVIGWILGSKFVDVEDKVKEELKEEIENKEEDDEEKVVIDYTPIKVETVKTHVDAPESLKINGKPFSYNGSTEFIWVGVQQIGDVLIVEPYEPILVVNKEGNIIARFGNSLTTDSTTPIIQYKGQTYRGYTIIGNYIYIISDIFANDWYGICEMDSNKIVEYTERFEYLGNGKFSEPTMFEEVTAAEYIATNQYVTCE